MTISIYNIYEEHKKAMDRIADLEDARWFIRPTEEEGGITWAEECIEVKDRESKLRKENSRLREALETCRTVVHCNEQVSCEAICNIIAQIINTATSNLQSISEVNHDRPRDD